MLLLEANNIKKYFQDRLLFALDTLKVYDGERIGIVGVNGAGKTTLMKILSEEIIPDEGNINSNVKSTSIYQTQYEPPEEVIVNDDNKNWTLNSSNSDSLSGGEKTRMQIAAALGKRTKLLLADEPTSHLDLAGIEQLEAEFNQFDGAIILISHDRTFLDKICTKIIEIEEGVVSEYIGNYSDYREQKNQQLQRSHFEYEQYVKEKKRLEEAARAKADAAKSMRKAPKRMGRSEAILHKNGAEAKRAKVNRAAKIIESRIEQLEAKEKPNELPVVQFDIDYFSPIHGKTAIQFENVTKSFASNELFSNFTFTIKPGSKTALIGANGTGKSTLLKMIVNEETGLMVSHSGKIGYFDQSLSQLVETKTIIENVKESSPYNDEMIRTVLARLLFKREDVFKPVSVLSGGEKVKVALAKVFLGDYNILLLDEPTNYLDIFTREQLENVLTSYPGTLLFATHDRSLMNRLADQVLIFANKKIESFSGNYDEYLQNKHKKKDAVAQNIKQELLKVENELTEVISRLSMPSKEDVKEMLEERYQYLLREKKRLQSIK